jgi:UDP-N-acetylmuramoylalanine--D-glutamate ligase
VQYINDTTATTPEGAIAGLHAYPPGHVILITGGNSKGLSLKEFSRQIQERAKLVIKLPGNANGKLPSGVDAADMKEAVTLAAEHARRGDVVLLSPGLSWLPVMNEFERGDVFNEEVGKL